MRITSVTINFQLQLIELEWSHWTIFAVAVDAAAVAFFSCWTVTLMYGRAYIMYIQNQTRLIKVFDLIAGWIANYFITAHSKD